MKKDKIISIFEFVDLGSKLYMLGLIEIIGVNELKLESEAGRLLFFQGKPCSFEEQRDSNGHNACQFLKSMLENTGMASVTMVVR